MNHDTNPETGRTRVFVHQSDIAKAQQCPEAVRRNIGAPDYNGDYALRGTAFHEAVAATLLHQKNGWPLPPGLGAQVIASTVAGVRDNPDAVVRWSKYADGDFGQLARDAITLYDAWAERVLPLIEQVDQIEYQFCFPVLVRADYEVWFRGAVDLVTAGDEGVIWDWKSGGRQKYGPKAEHATDENPSYRESWRNMRYGGIQPAVYSYAVAHYRKDLLVQLGVDEIPDIHDFCPTFRWCQLVLDDKGAVHIHTQDYPSTPNDWDFATMQADALAGLYMAELKHWPMGPNEWWCSPRWCDHWMRCRGAVEGPDPWGTMNSPMDHQIWADNQYPDNEAVRLTIRRRREMS